MDIETAPVPLSPFLYQYSRIGGLRSNRSSYRGSRTPLPSRKPKTSPSGPKIAAHDEASGRRSKKPRPRILTKILWPFFPLVSLRAVTHAMPNSPGRLKLSKIHLSGSGTSPSPFTATRIALNDRRYTASVQASSNTITRVRESSVARASGRQVADSGGFLDQYLTRQSGSPG